MADNRRTAIRHAVSIAGKFATSGAPADCTIVNLSLGGALLAATKRHAMGERCHINFKIPTIEEPIDIGGGASQCLRVGRRPPPPTAADSPYDFERHRP